MRDSYYNSLSEFEKNEKRIMGNGTGSWGMERDHGEWNGIMGNGTGSWGMERETSSLQDDYFDHQTITFSAFFIFF